MKQTISEEFRRHEKEVLSYEYEIERIKRIMNASGNESDYLTALQFLSQILYKVHGKKVIVLLDDRSALPKPYWSNTSSNNIVKALIEGADVQVKSKIEDLLEGKIIEGAIHEDITYSDIDKSEESLWNFLYFTGYLTKVSDRLNEGQIITCMRIPNKEINYIYKSKIMKWMREQI